MPVACQECKDEGRDDDDANDCGVCACGIRFCGACIHSPIEGTEGASMIRSEYGVQCMACAFFSAVVGGGVADGTSASSSGYESGGRGSEFDSEHGGSDADE